MDMDAFDPMMRRSVDLTPTSKSGAGFKQLRFSNIDIDDKNGSSSRKSVAVIRYSDRDRSDNRDRKDSNYSSGNP
jgi:hypothetical protein